MGTFVPSALTARGSGEGPGVCGVCVRRVGGKDLLPAGKQDGVGPGWKQLGSSWN